MNKAISLYLDLVRFLAAFAVLLAHVSSGVLSGGVLWRLSYWGGTAVSVFFVLSGYVIAYVLETRERSFLDYSASRFGRLYSVVLPALLLTAVCDYFGSLKDPQLYQGWSFPNWLPYFATAVFANRIWLVNASHGFEPGTNSPFWSLSFEAAYYAAIAVIVFLRGWTRLGAAIVFAAFVGPTILLLAPLWFAGYALFHWQARIRLSPIAAWLAFVTGLVICLSSFLLAQIQTPWDIPVLEPVDTLYSHYRQLGFLASRYVAAFGFVLNLLGFIQISKYLLASLERCEKPLRALGALTFPLYLFQFPLTYLLASYSIWPRASVMNTAWLIGGTFFFVGTVGVLCERSKGFYKLLYLFIYKRLWRGKKYALHPAWSLSSRSKEDPKLRDGIEN
jgi:peptidoglycan/LPS O-acetylase OafA/YrhL